MRGHLPSVDTAFAAPAHRRSRPEPDTGRGLVVVLVVTAVLSVLLYRHAWAHPGTTWGADIGDPEEIMWFLAWIPHAIIHGHSGLVTDYVLYPKGANAMWNPSVILPAFIMGPVTLLAGPIVSYNVLLTAAPVAAAFTAYLLFARYVSSKVAAGVGAVAFGFSPFLLYHQEGHQQLSLLALTPLILLMIDEAVVRQRWRWWVTGLALGLLVFAQLMTGEEILAMVGMLAVVSVVVLALLHPRQVVAKAGYALRSAGVAVVVFVICAAYPLWVQYRGPRRPGPVLHPPNIYLTDLANVIQPVNQLFHPQLVGNVSSFANIEPTGYIGIPLLVVIALAVLLNLRRRPVVPFAIIVMAIFGLLTLGPILRVDGVSHGPWIWALFEHFGPLKQLVPGRLMMIVDLFATFFLAVFVDTLVVAKGRVALRALPGLLVVAVLASWIPSTPPVTTIAVPPFFTTSAEDTLAPGSVALVVPYVYGSFSETAVMWQAESGMRFRMVDGWLAVPGPHEGPATALSKTLSKLQTAPVPVTPTLAARVKAVLAGYHIQEVIVGPGPGEANVQAFFTDLFARPADVRAGGVMVWKVRRA